MKKWIKAAAEVFGYLFGAGGFWSWLLFSEEFIEDENIDIKRSQFLFVFRPWLAAFWFWFLLSCLNYGLNIVINVSAQQGILGIFCGMIVFTYGTVRFWAGQIDQALNVILSPLASIFPYNPLFKVSAAFFYIHWYKLLRHQMDRKLIDCGKHLQENFAGLKNVLQNIYYETPGTGRIRLSNKWSHIKDNLGKIIFLNFFIVYILNLTTNFATVPIWDFTLEYIFPFAGVFSLMEAYHYLGLADSARNRRKADSTLDIMKLRVHYQQYVKEKGISMVCEYRRNHVFLKEELQIAEDTYMESEDQNIVFLYQYLAEKDQLKHIAMASRLMRGENIFYASPFYKDIDGCIFFTMFQTLLRQKKGLLLVEDDGKFEEMIQWMEDGLEVVTGLKRLWSVEILKEPVMDVDVGLLSLQSLGMEQELDRLNVFLKNVSFVVVLEASNMLAAGQETIIALAERIHSEHSKCTWLLCDWNAESMLDLFSHLLCEEFIYVNATPSGAKETVVSYWDIETEPDQIWSPSKRFLGLEAGIAEIAGKDQILSMTWYGEKWLPAFDMQWIIGQYYQLYSKKIAQPSNQSRIDNQIQCGISSISCGVENEKFLTVEDVGCNLYETGRQYLTRAKEKAYVHVLSPDYLLRDFMKAQPETMSADSKYIAQFAPEYVNSIRNVCIHLLRRLLSGNVSGREIYEQLKKCEEPPKLVRGTYDSFQAEEAIRLMAKMILYNVNMKEINIRTTVDCVFSAEKREIVREFHYHVEGQKIRREFYKYFRQASYVDETGKKCHINCVMLAGHMRLKYLPGQYAALSGKYYQVENILDQEETLLTVKRASEQVVERFFYRQLRSYEFLKQGQSEYPLKKLIFEEDGISLTRINVSFTGQTTGYLTLKKSLKNFSTAAETDCEIPTRTYWGKEVLCVEVSEKALGRKALFYLAAVIHDMFYTFYPKYYHLLSVAICWKDEEQNERFRYRGVLSDVKEEVQEINLGNCFYILEDSCEDMGLLRSLERHFHRILEIASDYIEWEAKNKRPLYFS